MSNDPIVIVSHARTAMAGLLGALSSLNAPQLGSHAIAACIKRSGIPADHIDGVIMGNVLSAGLGQAPARQAALKAGLSQHAEATTINKMCGSGMKAIMLAHDLLQAGSNQIMIAGGMESMSNAPYLIAKARQGYRLGHGNLKDSLFLDGLEDAYEPGTLMGVYADATAKELDISRTMQDDFAIRSTERAQHAIAQGLFQQEICPITIKSRKSEHLVDTDEQPGKARLDKIPQLKPAFNQDGTVTAANASSISDGAAALLLMRQSKANHLGLQPIARIVNHATHAQAPAWFTTAPSHAITNALEQAGWQAADVDLYEINEAFAVVTLAAMQALDLSAEKVNVNGGACALGHPIGASGARIMVTLIAALQARGLSRGIASLCIGGGEATAMAIELV